MKNWEICSYQLNISRVSFLFSDSSGQKGPLCSFEPIFMCKGWITILFSKVGQTMSFRKRSTLVFWIQSGSSHLITFSTKLVKWHLYNIKVSQHNITILEFITRNKDVSRWTGTWWFSRDKFSHSDFFFFSMDKHRRIPNTDSFKSFNLSNLKEVMNSVNWENTSGRKM